ncbi:hypothetical protein BDN72DRAFT_405897 [Pluteus cervinus]|uniref:Uncharacterized protein n=1 Tax=Pluteus cervinus TaxID=181527 RepID=A0ACD3A945_9AGAR|nr:hypothetical protein BDN72DRAFT_405897 [Pluteus cervinus]
MFLINLPPPLLERIVQAIKSTDAKSLQTLSLVCQTFLCPTQRQLFGSITLSTHPSPSIPYSPITPPAHLLRLRDILNENPILVTYIKDFRCIQLDGGLYGYPFGDWVQKKPWLIHHGLLLVEIIQLLKEYSLLRSFSIIYIPGHVRLKWSALQPTLQSTLIRCVFGKPTVTSVTFQGISLPKNILGAFVNLKNLHVKNVAWSRECTELPLVGAPGRLVHQLSSLHFTISSAPSPLLASLGPEIGDGLTGLVKLNVELSIDVPFSSITLLISSSNLILDLTVSLPCTCLPPTLLDQTQRYSL